MASTLIKTSDHHFQAGMHAGNMHLLENIQCDPNALIVLKTEAYIALYKAINGVFPPDDTARSYAAGLLQSFYMHTRSKKG